MMSVVAVGASLQDKATGPGDAVDEDEGGGDGGDVSSIGAPVVVRMLVAVDSSSTLTRGYQSGKKI